MSLSVPDLIWSVTGQPCQGTQTYKGTASFPPYPLAAGRADSEGHTVTFTLRQTQSTPYVVSIPGVFTPHCSVALTGVFSQVPITFNVTATVHIIGCEFNFVTNPNCYPAMHLDHLSAAGGAMLLARQESMTTSLAPAEGKVFDRSAGDISIQVGPASMQMADIEIFITLGQGPSAELDPSFDLPARMAAYAHSLGRGLDAFSDEPD